MPTQYKLEVFIPNPNGPRHFKGALAWIHGGKEGGGGLEQKVPAACNSKTVNGNKLNLVDYNEINNLKLFNWNMTSSLRNNDVITLKIQLGLTIS